MIFLFSLSPSNATSIQKTLAPSIFDNGSEKNLNEFQAPSKAVKG